MSYKGILHPTKDDFSQWETEGNKGGFNSIADNALSAGWSCFYFSFIPILGAFCSAAIIPCAIVAMVMGERREGIKLLMVSGTTIILVNLITAYLAFTLWLIYLQQAVHEALRRVH